MQQTEAYRERRASMKCTLDAAVAQYRQRRESLREADTNAMQTISARRNSISNRPLHLLDLPTEILEQILSHVHSSDEPIHISRRPDSPDFSLSELENGAIRRKWSVHGFPFSLFLVNSRISQILFARVWCDTPFVLSLSPTDALCFLKHALSERQRVALRRIRFTRFMLSWEDGVGDDIWLTAWKRAPKFLESASPVEPRVNGLVAHLQGRAPAAVGGIGVEA